VASPSIELTRPEAFDVLVAVDDGRELLRDTDFLVALLELEDASALLAVRLFPEAGP
jgi:hypothetical protein